MSNVLETSGSFNQDKIEIAPKSPNHSSEKVCQQFYKTEESSRVRRDHSNRKGISYSEWLEHK